MSSRPKVPPARRRSIGPALSLALALMLSAPSANAFVWPSAADRVARALDAADPSERAKAATEARGLPEVTAKPLVLRALADEEREVRLAAAQTASAFAWTAASDAVTPWLSEPDTKLRAAACRVIRRAPTPTSIAALGRVLGDPSEDVRVAAAKTLGLTGDPAAVTMLLGHVDDSSPEVRAEVAGALARLGDPKAVLPLVAKIQDTSPDVRRRVTRALGMLGDSRATTAVVLALGDVNHDVRLEAAAALGRLGSEDATLALAQVVAPPSGVAVPGPAAERSAALRQAAIRALGNIASTQAIGALVGALEGDLADDVRPDSADALVAIGAPAVPALVAVISGSPSVRVAEGAALALGRIGETSSAQAIVGASRRGLVSTSKALSALAELHADGELPFILEHLADDALDIRMAAISAASEIVDPTRPDGRPVDPVRDRLSDPSLDPEERVALVELLGRTGSPRAAELLVPLVSAKRTSLKRSAIRALGSTASSSDTSDVALVGALSDDSASVRFDAAVALSTMGSGSLAPSLLDRLTRGAEQDREALGIAVSGVLSRAERLPAAKVAEALDSAPSVARDAVIEGLGRLPATGEAERAVVSTLASVADVGLGDRRKVAEALGSHGDVGRALASKLLSDADEAVRANAAWSLGSASSPDVFEPLGGALSDANLFVAANAAASIGRVAGRLAEPARASKLCEALADARAAVRINAAAGLVLAGHVCTGDVATKALSSDPSERARLAIARLLRASKPVAGSAEALALDRCRLGDPSVRVARACEAPLAAPSKTPTSVLVFVVPGGSSEAVPHAAFGLELADGTVRLGLSDRRGAVFEARAPEGSIELVDPIQL